MVFLLHFLNDLKLRSRLHFVWILFWQCVKPVTFVIFLHSSFLNLGYLKYPVTVRFALTLLSYLLFSLFFPLSLTPTYHFFLSYFLDPTHNSLFTPEEGMSTLSHRSRNVRFFSSHYYINVFVQLPIYSFRNGINLIVLPFR